MLVEDDNNLRAIYGDRLLAEGYEIVSARDGEEALAMSVKEKPNLIISDVMMPKISGFDMLDILRSTPETKDVKVIMMTALSQAEDKERADKLGADKYLVKSQVTLEDVARVVHEVLGDGNPAEAATASDTPIAAQAAEPIPATTPVDPIAAATAALSAAPPVAAPAPVAPNPFEVSTPATPVVAEVSQPTVVQSASPTVPLPSTDPLPATSASSVPTDITTPSTGTTPQDVPTQSTDSGTPAASSSVMTSATNDDTQAASTSSEPVTTPVTPTTTTPISDPNAPADSFGGVKKVIQPINDLSATAEPKIYELYEKEMANEAGSSPVVAPTATGATASTTTTVEPDLDISTLQQPPADTTPAPETPVEQPSPAPGQTFDPNSVAL